MLREATKNDNGKAARLDVDATGASRTDARQAASKTRAVVVEVTQGVQASPLDDDWSGRSVPLVAAKAAVVRIFVLEPSLVGKQLDVTVTLEGDGVRPERKLLALSAKPFVAVETPDRGAADHSVNFVIDAAECVGDRVLRVEVKDGKASLAALSEQLQFVPVPDLPMVVYLPKLTRKSGQGLTVEQYPKVGSDRLKEVLTLAQAVFPTSFKPAHIVSSMVFEVDKSQQAIVGLAAELALARLLVSFDGVFLGMLPKEAQKPSDFDGQTKRRAAAVFDDANDIVAWSGVAHEVGHLLRRRHSPFARAEGNDPAYPMSAARPPGSLDQYGTTTDVTSPGGLKLYRPENAFDYMCDGTPSLIWVSAYGYRATLEALRLKKWRRLTGPGTLREVTYVVATVGSDGKLAEHLIATFPGAKPTLAAPTRVVGVVRDKDGCECRSLRFHLPESHADFTKGGRILLAALSACPALHTIELREGDVPIGTITLASVEAPSNVRAELRHDQTYRVTWDGTTEGIVRYSPDGRSWFPVAFGQSPPVDIDLADLPGGEQARFGVLALGTSTTVRAESQAFANIGRPAEPVILHPANDSRFEVGKVIELSAWWQGVGDASVELKWRVSKRIVARGQHAFIQLSQGQHTVTLHAPGVKPARVAIHVGPEDELN